MTEPTFAAPSRLDVPRTVGEIVNLCGDVEQACIEMDPRKAEDALYGLMMRARAFRQYLTEGGCLPFPETVPMTCTVERSL